MQATPALATEKPAVSREGTDLRLLASPRAPAIILGLALLLAATSFVVEFCTDDYSFRAALRDHHRANWDLFHFSGDSAEQNARGIAIGRLPWWTAPDFRLHFFRPLTSLLFAFDNAAFGDHPAAYHLHSLLWLFALLFLASRIFRRAVRAPVTASLALLVFALRSGHVLPYAWLSARHVLIGGVLSAGALLAHMRATEDGWRIGRVLAPLLLVGALCGSEASLAIVPLWVAFDFARARSRFVASSAPAVAIAFGYLAFYHVAGFGAHASRDYTDPFVSPIAFARVTGTRVPMLLGDALLGIPVFASQHHHPVALGVFAVVACTVGVGLGWSRIRKDSPEAAWCLIGALFGLVVGVSGLPGGRVLLIPDLGFSVFVAVLIHTAFARVTGGRLKRLAAGGVGALLVLMHVVVAPLASLVEVLGLRKVARATERIALGVELPEEARNRVFILGASDPHVFLYPRGIIDQVTPGLIGCWSVLSAAPAGHRLTRSDASSFDLESTGDPMLSGFDALFRDPDRAFVVGDSVRQCGATIRVEELRDGKPTRIHVAFEHRLESMHAAFLVWKEGKLRRFEFPAIGAATEIAFERGVR